MTYYEKNLKKNLNDYYLFIYSIIIHHFINQ